MHPPDQARKRIFPLRNGDQMDVVAHPTPAEQIDAAGREVKREQLLVAAPVFVGQEDVLAVVAAMGDGMRYADRHHPTPRACRGIDLA